MAKSSAEMPIKENYPMDESALRRACGNWWRSLTGSPWMWFWSAFCGLVGVGVGAYLAYSGHSRWGVVFITVGSAAAGLLLALGSAFVWQWIHIAPMKQRDEARLELVRVKERSGFPSHETVIKTPWGYKEGDDMVFVVDLRVTNRDANRRINLAVDAMYQIVYSREDNRISGPHRLLRYYGEALRDQLSPPLGIDPMDTIEGVVVFHGDASWMRFFPETYDVFVEERHEVFLRLTDHVSGATEDWPLDIKTVTKMKFAPIRSDELEADTTGDTAEGEAPA